MAEGLLRGQAGDRAEAFSAGVSAGGVHPLAVQAMAEVDLDISGHTSKIVADLEPGNFDLVITLCDEARGVCASPATASEDDRRRLFGGVPVFLHWTVADPAAATGDEDERLRAFREARDIIAGRIEGLLDHGYLAAFARERDRLQRFADMLQEGILIHDEFRNVFLVNRAFLQMTGLSREDILGKDCHEVFTPGGLCGAGCKFCEEPETATGRCEHRTRFVTTRGENKQLKVTIEPLEIEPGIRGVLGVVRDETEVRDLRAKLRQRRSFHGMIGAGQAIQEVFATIESVSASEYPVLITGESGTGKELVARAIHAESNRQAGPFVPVNCGALPENIIESELFGHVRGAFTGAIRDKKGRFELAGRGTLFLDEVGELPAPTQVKLLRVLQEKRFERVGGEKTLRADSRIISATNRDLRQMVRQGEFREDLFYRLCVVPISLPPLRERGEDLPFLVEHILVRIREETGKPIQSLEDEAIGLLHAYVWPGNIRELINALQFASVRCEGKVIRARDLPPEIRHRSGTSAVFAVKEEVEEEATPLPEPGIARGRRPKLSGAAVERALAATGGNKARAARLLGVGRATLYRFLDRQKD